MDMVNKLWIIVQHNSSIFVLRCTPSLRFVVYFLLLHRFPHIGKLSDVFRRCLQWKLAFYGDPKPFVDHSKVLKLSRDELMIETCAVCSSTSLRYVWGIIRNRCCEAFTIRGNKCNFLVDCTAKGKHRRHLYKSYLYWIPVIEIRQESETLLHSWLRFFLNKHKIC